MLGDNPTSSVYTSARKGATIPAGMEESPSLSGEGFRVR